MKDFPLQEELIDAVIGFANADLSAPEQVRNFFGGSWEPRSLPELSQCRRVRTETRKWLTEVSRGIWPDAVPAMLGYEDSLKLKQAKVDSGIRFVGSLGFTHDWQDGKLRRRVVWKWWVQDASLRAICGLGVASILHAGIQDRVGLCARDGCGTFFIDRKSRGMRRQYCLRPECNLQRNKDRVKKARGKK